MNGQPLSTQATIALLASAGLDVMLGLIFMASSFGLLPWDFAAMLGLPPWAMTLIGTVLTISGAGVMMWMVFRRSDQDA